MYYELKGSGVEISCVLPSIVNTELAAGLGTSRLTPTVQPRDVADVVAHVLRYPQFEAFVPRNLMASNKLMRLFPRPVLDKIAGGRAGALLSSAAHSTARADYERRASRARSVEH